MGLPLAGDAAADYRGGVAGKDGVFLVEGAVEAAHGPDGGVWRERGAFGNDNVASEPHMVCDADRAVGVAPLSRGVGKAVLVSIHEGAAPGGLHMVAKRDLMVAHYERRGAEVEAVAEGEGAGFGDFDAGTCPDGTLAHDVEGAAEVEEGALAGEIGLLAGVEAYLDKTHTESVGVKKDMPRKVVDFGAVGDKQREPSGLSKGQQAEIEPHAARESERKAQEVEPFDAVPFVHTREDN